jgi:thymidylate synthase ThyX
MPTVTLIDYTGCGRPDEAEYAARLLAFTKNTRLQMTPNGFQDWLDKPWSEIEPELVYMTKTIPSSHEFVDATFTIQGVTRAFAQQLTRTRFTPIDGDIFGSYAMQTQRVLDVRDAEITVPPSVQDEARLIYDAAAAAAVNGYKRVIEAGASLEDARGLLPMNVQCNLVAKFNLRSMAEMFRKRESLRVQDEFVTVVRAMRTEVERVWPWAASFFVPKDTLAIEIIEGVAKTLPEAQRRELAKAADLLKL